MLEFAAQDFVIISDRFNTMISQAANVRATQIGSRTQLYDAAPSQLVPILVSYIEEVVLVGERMGAFATTAGAKRLIGYFEHNTSLSSFVVAAQMARSTFYDEMERWRLLVLNPDDCKLIDNPMPMGEKVFNNFPSCRDEIREASRCLALESPGACVFHLMRIIEKPLKVSLDLFGLGNSVNQPWGNILNQIEAKVFAQVKPTPEQEFGRTLIAYIHSVKNIRNARLMHVDEPLPDMTVASHLYTHIKSMMEHIAEHLDEHGNFTNSL